MEAIILGSTKQEREQHYTCVNNNNVVRRDLRFSSSERGLWVSPCDRPDRQRPWNLGPIIPSRRARESRLPPSRGISPLAWLFRRDQVPRIFLVQGRARAISCSLLTPLPPCSLSLPFSYTRTTSPSSEYDNKTSLLSLRHPTSDLPTQIRQSWLPTRQCSRVTTSPTPCQAPAEVFSP